MKRVTIIFIFILQSTISFAQTEELKQTEKWIVKNDIELNSPLTPIGFERKTDCKEQPIYRKNISDTIVLYTWGGSIAEDLDKFKLTTQEEGFNIYRYPTKIQKNGTVIVNRMSQHEFIWRNDTLYLLDDYNEAASKARLKLMKDRFADKISKDQYEKELKEFDESKYPFTPKFKIIYFTGIFDNSIYYVFAEKENFRQEKVELIDKWMENGKMYYEINLDTYTNGRYRFTDDLTEIERNNCRKK